MIETKTTTEVARAIAHDDRLVGIEQRTTEAASGANRRDRARPDDCAAVRLARSYRRRFGTAARERSAIRLERAVTAGHLVKADLFVAVEAILRDDAAVFSRSRA